jgi:hypothetical protein
MSTPPKAPGSPRKDAPAPASSDGRDLDFYASIPAELLRRVAEAADGHRGQDYWFVFSVDEEDHPNGRRRHFVSRGFERKVDTDPDIEASSRRHRIGPFRTPAWGNKRERTMTGLTVRSRRNNQAERTHNLSPGALDSIFWTESAIDKFLIPYYVRIHGWAYGADLHAAFNEPEVFALTHLPGSEYVARMVESPTKGEGFIIEEITPGYAARKAAEEGS